MYGFIQTPAGTWCEILLDGQDTGSLRGTSMPNDHGPDDSGTEKSKISHQGLLVPPYLSVESRRPITFSDVSGACYQYRNSIESVTPYDCHQNFQCLWQTSSKAVVSWSIFPETTISWISSVTPLLLSSSKLPTISISQAEAKVVPSGKSRFYLNLLNVA